MPTCALIQQRVRGQILGDRFILGMRRVPTSGQPEHPESAGAVPSGQSIKEMCGAAAFSLKVINCNNSERSRK